MPLIWRLIAYAAAIFPLRRLDIDVQATTAQGQQDADVLVTLDEAPTIFEAYAGWIYEGLRGGLTYTDNHVLGKGAGGRWAPTVHKSMSWGEPLSKRCRSVGWRSPLDYGPWAGFSAKNPPLINTA